MRERSEPSPVGPPIDLLVLSGPARALSRYRLQLAEQGLELGEYRVLADRSDLAAALADDHGPAHPRPAAVLDGAVVTSATPLGAVLDDPRVPTGVLAVADGGRWAELGVLKVNGRHRQIAAAVARAGEPGPGGAGAGMPSGPGSELVLELVRGLGAAEVDVRPVPLRGYAWARVTGGADAGTALDAVAAVDAVDERRTRLREAARGGDGFYSTFVLRKLSWRLTGLAERAGLTPNQVTVASFLLGLAAAGFVAVGSRPWAVAGALVLQLCLVIDCVDGELARYRRRFSRFGAWLDATTDRVKEFAVIAALAVAGYRAGGHRDLWWLAAAAIGLQTFRNLLDLGWSLQRAAVDRARPAAPAPVWVAAPAGFRAPGRPAGEGAATWVRRVGHFPVGERFLLLSIGAAFGSARGTLLALLAAGLLAAGYLVAAFAVRCRAFAAPAPALERLVWPAGLLARPLHRVTGGRAGRGAAVLPALVAVAELALVWALVRGVAGGPGWLALALVAALSLATYQQAYHVREDVKETGSDGGPQVAAAVATSAPAERIGGAR